MADLYHPAILELSKNPVGFEKRPDAQYIVEAYNPVCADQFEIFFDLKEGKIENLTFHGYGCALSKASGSTAVRLLSGLDLQGSTKFWNDFQSIIQNTGKPDIPDLEPFSPVKDHPGRIKCVTLIWEEFFKELERIK
ncbi:MAG: iron-sulfur cluster assembly scaffold protein [Cyclobacteriaceae bacterium]